MKSAFLKVILNPQMDLEPRSYNVSIQSDVIANLESLRHLL